MQDAMTEEQRMEEGRRMFQIFAARMFEQRVLTAYREKVAHERQRKLLEELEEEKDLDKQREAKKAREAAKKKAKKALQKQAQAEEKARKEAEKAEQERAMKEAEEKKQEEQRRKREEQRKKRDAERKAQEEERQRKETERIKRQQEERDRQQEAERKQREEKAQAKKMRDEAKRKEREEREAREKEAREKKSQEEKLRREREKEAKVKADKEARERSKKEEQSAVGTQINPQSLAKRTNPTVPIALPPGLLSKQSSTGGYPSPQVHVATPALPKAPTPSKQPQTSQQGSHGSSPKTPHIAPGASKSASSPAPMQAAQNFAPVQKTILKPPQQTHTSPLSQQQPSAPMPPIGPPPGMHPTAPGQFAMPPGINGFPHQTMPLPGMAQRGPMGHNAPPFQPQMNINTQFRPFAHGSLPPPPPGMSGPPMMPHGRGMPVDIPPGFGAPLHGIGPNPQAPGFGRDSGLPHSRNQSGSYDKPPFDPTTIASQRPAPIQRPSSVKPTELRPEDRDVGSAEIDDLSRHLGSSALLDDADDLPSEHDIRHGNVAPSAPLGTRMPFGNPSVFPEPGQPRMDPFAMGSSSGPGSAWSTPTLPNPFGPMSSGAGWGNSPTGSLPGGLFNNAFGAVMNQRGAVSRPQTIRLAACQVCKNLSIAKPSSDEYHEVDEVLQAVNRHPTVVDRQVQKRELLEIFETEGDEHNGGGLFLVDDRDSGTFVKFEEGSTPSKGRTPGGLGEIGSPLPGHSVPVGFGAPRGLYNPGPIGSG
jgi:hypothetical protein